MIIDALQSSGAPMTQPRFVGNGGDIKAQCDALFGQFDAEFDKLTALPTLAARRAAAISLYPFMERTIRTMRARDFADGLHEDHVSLRGDRVFCLLMIGFEAPCDWSRAQVWGNLVTDEEGNADA